MKLELSTPVPAEHHPFHWLAWAVFMFCSVYGHVALKIAVDQQQLAAGRLSGMRGVMSTVLSLWGGSAISAWGLSALLWIVVLSRHTLLEANAISALSYALISVAAWWFLSEPLSRNKIIGVALIAIGIWLVKGGR